MASVVQPTSASTRPVGHAGFGSFVCILSLVALAAVILPWLGVIGGHLWARPHYQVMPLVLLGVAVVAASRWPGLGQLQPGAWRIVLVGFAVAVPALAVAFAAYSPVLGGAGLLVMMVAGVYGLGGWKLLRAMFPALVLIALMVPLPFGFDQRLVQSLQRVTTDWSSHLLDLFGVEHAVSGNVIQIPGKDLFVEQACSGVHSFFTILAATLFYVLWQRRPTLHVLLLLGAAAGWVLVGNAIRAAFLAYAFQRWNADLLTGWKHLAVGFAVFFVTLFLVLSTDALLRFLWQSPRSPSDPERSQSPTRLPDLTRTWLGWLPVPLVLGALALFQFGFVGIEARDTGRPAAEFEAALHQLDADLFPKQWAGWERKDFVVESREVSSEFGANSRAWMWAMPEGRAVISADFVFSDWHDLRVCYRSTGWSIEEAGFVNVDGVPVTILRMNRPGSRFGYVLFTHFDKNGSPVSPSPTNFFNRLDVRMARFSARWFGTTEQSAEPEFARSVCQVQMLVESYQPLSPAEQERALKQFLEAAERIRQASQS
ncbi:MAG: exosortase U [Gemmatales bacterium]|nr:exosortase U [Gemmatales bacterium]MDW8386922.1 exosortase U [Gemmatales bacterium]